MTDLMLEAPDDNGDDELRIWTESTRGAMPGREAKWRDEGRVFRWLRSDPDIAVGGLCWWWDEFDPTEPTVRRIRFSLIGGGQITHVGKWSWHREPESRQQQHQQYLRWCKEQPDVFTPVTLEQYSRTHKWRDEWYRLWPNRHDHIVVKAHVADNVRVHRGAIEKVGGEVMVAAVVFPMGTPQEIADRAASTLAATDMDQDAFFALLDSSAGCALCGKPLRDEISKLVGVGPDCARKNGIPHAIAAANKRLELRRRLLGEMT